MVGPKIIPRENVATLSPNALPSSWLGKVSVSIAVPLASINEPPIA